MQSKHSHFIQRGAWKRLLQISAILAVLGTAALGGSVSQKAVAAPEPQATFPNISLQQYASGLAAPTAIASAHDGTGRLFVTEKDGRIRIVEGGAITGTFLDISARVSKSGERGLLGLAFPTGYAASGRFYVFYTNLGGDIVISRFQVSGDPDNADPGSENDLLTIEHSSADNHNGGMIAFGPDGYLYIATGDGGGGGDPNGNGQRLDTLLGKILRIDVEGVSAGGPQAELSLPPDQDFHIFLPFVTRGPDPAPVDYLIPPTNPFVDTPGALPEIWAYGLRNPWRFSFDRETGSLFIADVGQGSYEEIDYQPVGPGGQNYGWNVMEGPDCYNAPSCDTSGKVLPVAWYPHEDGGTTIGCSVTGGYVYRGASNPSMQGFYFFSDYCTGRIWGLATDGSWDMQELKGVGGKYATFGEGEDGELYIADIATGVIYRIVEQ